MKKCSEMHCFGTTHKHLYRTLQVSVSPFGAVSSCLLNVRQWPAHLSSVWWQGPGITGGSEQKHFLAEVGERRRDTYKKLRSGGKKAREQLLGGLGTLRALTRCL